MSTILSLSLAIEIAGWLGASAILLAYGLLSLGKLQSSSPSYQWLNVFGATGFILNSGWNGAYPSVALNIIWISIGLKSLWNLRNKDG